MWIWRAEPDEKFFLQTWHKCLSLPLLLPDAACPPPPPLLLAGPLSAGPLQLLFSSDKPARHQSTALQGYVCWTGVIPKWRHNRAKTGSAFVREVIYGCLLISYFAYFQSLVIPICFYVEGICSFLNLPKQNSTQSSFTAFWIILLFPQSRIISAGKGEARTHNTTQVTYVRWETLIVLLVKLNGKSSTLLLNTHFWTEAMEFLVATCFTSSIYYALQNKA